ncbi:uncharacterized protein LOC102705249 isoform X2 [Oryza brachyantha]|uniref:uncharacterized protein LOC102705249 isoform X2 n=1 Tax=Oryza brachyantha TaxID=4533 RepID=UPI001ADA052E|nr:uncharacterized protein LOC102705249 isoform X2 [Oryza brachyantha]
MGVTFAQVSRHYRHYKENWKIVERALNKSGNGFDATKCKLTISESEKACLKDRDRRLLAKPIKYFHEMQELFSGSNADGSLAIDQQTCMDVDSKSDNSDWEGMNDMASYPHPIDIAAEDSDTLPSPVGRKRTSSPDNCSPSTSRLGAKRARGVKSPSKKQPKPKSRLTDAAEKIGNTMDHLLKNLASAPPPPPVPQLSDPHATLWKRVEVLTITTNDKISVGKYLGRQENEGMRGFLTGSSDTTLETWVYQFLCKRDAGTLR